MYITTKNNINTTYIVVYFLGYISHFDPEFKVNYVNFYISIGLNHCSVNVSTVRVSER